MAEKPRSEHIGQRKAEHLEICTDPDSYAVETGSTMLDGVQLIDVRIRMKDGKLVKTEEQVGQLK